MYSHALLFSSVLMLCTATLVAQNVGINTTQPERSLEIEGTQDQFVRLQSTTSLTNEVGLELVNGTHLSGQDWKISNDGGVFRIATGIDNFNSSGSDILRIHYAGNVGLKSSVTESRLHIDNGQDASETQDGFLLIGTKTGTNLVADNNEINARINGQPQTLKLQHTGGNTFIGQGGGNIYFGEGGLSIGTTLESAKLALRSNQFQLHIRNGTNGENNWYLGASNPGWSAGGDQFLISPNTTSDAAVFRLMDVTDNDGTQAPVMIRSAANQTLLLDGNEIDGKDGALYFNHNSNQETYINPSGGNVGIGTTNPSSILTVKTPADDYALRLQRDAVSWNIHPYPVIDRLAFVKNENTLGQINGANGQWIALSDRNVKEDFMPLLPVLDKVNQMGVYTYTFRHDASHTPQIGVIAQELEPLFPEVVSNIDDQYKVAYAQLAVIALKALQEQQEEIDALQKELSSMLQGNK